MNYYQLQSILRHIRKTVSCPSCGGNYQFSDLEIVNVAGGRVTLAVSCKGCSSKTLVVVSEPATRKPRKIKKEKEGKTRITPDEVLEMRDFLGNFKGEMRDIFKK